MINIRIKLALLLFSTLFASNSSAAWLEVKPGVRAIVKSAPSAHGDEYPDRLEPGTQVERLSEVTRYYEIQLPDGRTGWSYKGNFLILDSAPVSTPTSSVSIDEQSLLARSDVLKIIIIDVEVGDATLIICPLENGKRDVLLIDTGENDADRIEDELIKNGFTLSDQPITQFMITHYHKDHFGDAPLVIPYAKVIYDRGDINTKSTKEMKQYLPAVNKPGVHRRTMTLDYDESFSGGVRVECVAVNRKTDFNQNQSPSSSDENSNSLAFIISFRGFDYFTGGDLTKDPERSLATGIRNCDVYHANHHGSDLTSSVPEFIKKLDPELSIASNGTKHGHPRIETAKRLIDSGSKFLQTNLNKDDRAYQPDLKFVADDTYFDQDEDAEEQEGPLGTIKLVVDPVGDKYYVLMRGLPLAEAVFSIEH